MHDAMKKLLPGAMFIGFTGTPLLKADKTTSFETFGSFIHTYKFDEAVEDGVVLDLRYEARNIDQHLTSPAQVDKWFDAKTKGMTDLSRAELKKRWGTMQKVVSAEPRAKQIVNDILLDMETKPRLMDRPRQRHPRRLQHLPGLQVLRAVLPGRLQGQVRHRHQLRAAAGRHLQGGLRARALTEKLRQYEIYRQMLADHFGEPADTAMYKVEQFEQDVKEQFVKHPGQMRLLIVVDKLLTGFDAPPRDLPLHRQDHARPRPVPGHLPRQPARRRRQGLRLHRRLPRPVQLAAEAPSPTTPAALSTAMTRRTSKACCTDRLEKAREDLDEALETIRAICEPVAPPKNTLQYQQYFCAAEPGNAEQLKANEPKRVELYKAVAAVTRAYGNLANEMERRRVHRRRGRRDQDGDRPLRGGPRRGQARRRREHRLQAVRSRHALPARHLHPGRRLGDGRRLRGHRADPAHRPDGRRRASTSCRRASRTTPRPSPRRSPTTCARSSSTSTR